MATLDTAISNLVRDPDLLVEISILKTDCLASLEQLDEAYKVIDDLVGNSKIPPELKPDLLIQKASLLREAGDEDGQEKPDRFWVLSRIGMEKTLNMLDPKEVMPTLRR